MLDQHLIDTEAEMAVLGAILCQPETVSHVTPIVTAADFGINKHRLLFDVMTKLAAAGRPPDVYHVAKGMQKVGLEQFAPEYESYLAELIGAVPWVTYAPHYAEAVAEMAERRRFTEAMQQSVTSVYQGGDVDALIEATNTHLKAVSRPRSRGRYRHIADVDDDVFGAPIPRSFFGGNFWEVDEIVGGIEAGQMVVIGARTSVGKTATLLQMLWTMAEVHGAPVGIISLEMSDRALRTRVIGRLAHVDIAAVKRERRTYSAAEWTRLNEAKERFEVTPYYIDQEVQRSLASVVERIRAMRAEQRIECVGIDYLQLLADNGKTENRAQEMARISGAIKQLAMELNIPIICLAQLNRGIESRNDPEPQLSDFKDSGAIEQDSDVAILLHADKAFKAKRLGLDKDKLHLSPQTFVRFSVAKNRNGATGSVVLEYVGKYTEFMPLPVDGGTR